MQDASLPFSPASERNKAPILQVLKEWLPGSGTVLEIAAGTGQHAVHFAQALPRLVWQPSDPSREACEAIEARRRASGLANLRAPLALDATRVVEGPIANSTDAARLDAIVCINMAHISPWEATLGLLDNAQRLLIPGGLLILYGPWLQPDTPTAPGNLAFDASLRARDPRWGLRDIDALVQVADERAIDAVARIVMPANNLTLVLRKRGEEQDRRKDVGLSMPWHAGGWQDVVRFAQVNESTWCRDPGLADGGGAGWGIHHLDPAPWNRLKGPVAARGPASGLIEVGGRIVCSWGEPDRADYTFSVAKTYLALLAGIASREGLLVDVDEPVVNRVPGIGFDHGAARSISWRHLLQQTSEWEGSCFGVPDQVDRYRRIGFQPAAPDAGQGFALPVKGDARPLRAPGTFWEYNDVRINQLSLALLHLFREPLPEVFAREVLRPIGASNDWSWLGYDDSTVEIDGQRMQSVPGGTHWGGGVRISARDQLRIARMLLDRGLARRQPDSRRTGGGAADLLDVGAVRVLPSEWIDRMLEPCAIAPFYGFLGWLNRERVVMPSASAQSWFAIGAGSSIVWHDASRDLVAVFRWIEATATDGLVARVLAALEGPAFDD